MIFLTIGTHEPFDRLVRAVDGWAARHPDVGLFAQVTPGGFQPRHMAFAHRLAPADYRARMDAARLIVAHAGMGSIITAMDRQRPILVMPRRGHLGETRNDHQWATVRRLEGTPGILVADDADALLARLDALAEGGFAGAQSLPPIAPYASDALIAAIRAAVFS